MATRAERIRYALWFLRQTAVFERAATRELAALLRAEASAVAAVAARGDVDDALDRSARAIHAALEEAKLATSATIARAVAMRLGDDPDAKAKPKPSKFLRDLLDYVQETALAASRKIAGTSRAIVRQVLADAEREGVGSAEAGRRLRQKLTALAPWRAATIARTETHDAASYAASLAAHESESAPRLTKEWVATLDDRVRDTHAEADGMRVPLDEPFIVGGYALERPCDPSGPPEETINCRCVSLYESPTPFGGV